MGRLCLVTLLLQLVLKKEKFDSKSLTLINSALNRPGVALVTYGRAIYLSIICSDSHTHTHIYIYIYMCVRVCVCVCVCCDICIYTYVCIYIYEYVVANNALNRRRVVCVDRLGVNAAPILNTAFSLTNVYAKW